MSQSRVSPKNLSRPQPWSQVVVNFRGFLYKCCFAIGGVVCLPKIIQGYGTMVALPELLFSPVCYFWCQEIRYSDLTAQGRTQDFLKGGGANFFQL